MAEQGASLSLPLVTAVFTQAVEPGLHVDPVVFTAFQWENTFNLLSLTLAVYSSSPGTW